MSQPSAVTHQLDSVAQGRWLNAKCAIGNNARAQPRQMALARPVSNDICFGQRQSNSAHRPTLEKTGACLTPREKQRRSKWELRSRTPYGTDRVACPSLGKQPLSALWFQRFCSAPRRSCRPRLPANEKSPSISCAAWWNGQDPTTRTSSSYQRAPRRPALRGRTGSSCSGGTGSWSNTRSTSTSRYRSTWPHCAPPRRLARRGQGSLRHTPDYDSGMGIPRRKAFSV